MVRGGVCSGEGRGLWYLGVESRGEIYSPDSVLK